MLKPTLKIIPQICVYCEELKELRLWKETGELVCYDCRISQVDQDFEPIELPLFSFYRDRLLLDLKLDGIKYEVIE